MKVDKKFVGLFFALVLTSGCGLSIGDDNTWDVTSQTDTGVTVEAVGTVEVVPDGVQFNFSVFAVGPTSVAATQAKTDMVKASASIIMSIMSIDIIAPLLILRVEYAWRLLSKTQYWAGRAFSQLYKHSI